MISRDLLHGPLDDIDMIEVPLTGVNSPSLDQEDVISTRYIEAPQYPRKRRGGQDIDHSVHINQLAANDQRQYESPQQAADGFGLPNSQQTGPGTNHLGVIPEVNGEMFYFQNMADWNFDFLSSYPMQMT